MKFGEINKMKKDLEIKIQKGNSIFTTKRSDFISCSETADGVVFQMKGGILLHYTDNQMDNSIKMKIKLTIDSMSTGNIIIDFNDLKNTIQFFAPE